MLEKTLAWLDAGAPHVLFDMRVADTKPKYNPLVTAMVIWEEILDEGNDFDVLGGVCATRDHFAKMVPEVEQAFHYALTLGYDEPFDWDFVPWFLTLLDDDLKLPDDWAQPVWEHCQK